MEVLPLSDTINSPVKVLPKSSGFDIAYPTLVPTGTLIVFRVTTKASPSFIMSDEVSNS